jgi:hypothetical protein
MKRRDLLLAGAAAMAARGQARKRVLYYTRSAGFEHSVVHREGNAPSHSERLLTEFAGLRGFDVECTKDGRVFDGDLAKYDVIAAYATGDLMGPSKDGGPPMTAAGKRKLIEAVAAGKGFVGIHAATDACHSGGEAVDPYIAMLGGEFLTHGDQQEASLIISDPKFPGVNRLGMADGIAFTDEWYVCRNLAPDLHVILTQETRYMKGDAYRRPDFPATWARLHGKGRVFYTSLGHREDLWSNPFFQTIVCGGLEWTSGLAAAEVPPNIHEITPKAEIRKAAAGGRP